MSAPQTDAREAGTPIEVGQWYQKKAPPRSGRTKPENRGVRSVVEIIRIDGDGVVSLRLVGGPLLFTNRMAAGCLIRDFELIGADERAREG